MKKWKNKRNRKKLYLVFTVSFLFFLSLSLYWAVQNFGNISMEQIVFTLNMPLDGSGNNQIFDFLIKTVVPSVVVFSILYMFMFSKHKYEYSINFGKKKWLLYPIRTSKSKILIVLLVWLICIVSIANKNFLLKDYVYNQVMQSDFIEDNYVDPNNVTLKFPKQKRNLIYILMESAESSNQDRAHGGLFETNYIPEMTQIAEENVSFSQSDKIEGAAVSPATGWTIAGMVAESSGLPLKLYKYDDRKTDNSMENYQHFLPGMTNLGDILEAQGYKNYFMLGSDIRFSGRDKFMKQHGNYEIWDYDTAVEKNKIPSDYYEWWGFEDRKLYEYAKEELTSISQKDEPFNFTMLTVDTHASEGYVCPLCKNEHPMQYGNVWSCASRQVYDFVKWIQEQPFYENTTIVIAGDHCSMDPEFYKGFAYDKHHGTVDRKVYNAIINPAIDPVQEKNRKFVTMDLFPTTLAAMGVNIEGNRLGLGTNLFSKEKTLAERFGYSYMFEELDKKSAFYNKELLYYEK